MTMRMNVVNSSKFKITEEELEDVTSLTYLGIIISNDGGPDKDIKCRI